MADITDIKAILYTEKSLSLQENGTVVIQTSNRMTKNGLKEVLKEYGLQIVKTKDERDGRTAWQVKGKGARELKDVLKELGAKSINTSINEKAAWTFYGEEDPSVRILERVQQGATVTEPQSLEELQKQSGIPQIL